MRVFAAKNGMHFYYFLLPFQSFQIVGNGNQVYCRRELVSRMAPIAIGKNAQLPAFDKVFETFLYFGKIANRTFWPWRNTLCYL